MKKRVRESWTKKESALTIPSSLCPEPGHVCLREKMKARKEETHTS